MKVKYKAFPTIPIIFVSSVHADRVPLHNSMGLAITDLNEETRVETSVEFREDKEISFVLNGEELPKERFTDVAKVVKEFQKISGIDKGVHITSNNYNIYSGSSDAGAAALVFCLNDLFETNLSIDELAEMAMKISESAIRAVYGGLTEINVDGYPRVIGKQLASEEDLKDIRIFVVGFEYKSRVSAQEIFQVTRANPFYEGRLKMIPVWVAKIKWGLLRKDWDMVFKNSEENCHNAHQLLEYMDVYARRKEMINVCYDVVHMRKEGLKAYWTAGGGNSINVFSWGKDADEVKKRLEEAGYPVKEFKVAGKPKRID